MRTHRGVFGNIKWMMGLLALLSGCASGPESRFLRHIRQITFSDMGFKNAGEAYFAPDGKRIIFQATPQDKDDYQIYVMDLSGGAPRMVSTGKGACTCAFFRPDGQKILFASSHLDPDVDKPKEKKKGRGYEWDLNPYMDIFEANPDGSDIKRLTDAPGYDAEESYSPDGNSIVFASDRDGDLEVYVMDADGRNPQRLTNAAGWDGGPFFSPDGRRIIYRGDHRGDGKQNLQLRIINKDGQDDRALTDNEIFNWCPYWHPSGEWIIFTQTDHGAYARGGKPNYDLFLTTPRGDRFERVTFDEAFDGLPVFSPDGKRLMWTSKRGGLDEAQVFIADFRMPRDLQ